MKIILQHALLCATLAVPISLPRQANAQEFLQWAPRPVLGWNSWDIFATTITETQAKAQAAAMARQLLPHGWNVFTVDIQWYEPNAAGFDYRAGAQLTMDEFGRLVPAPNRFPSAKNGAGFKSLADDIHGKGLKFGLHLMRGIPRQAVAQNTPIFGTNFHAKDIADTSSVCPWNTDMYGVDMSKPGAQAYYDSVFKLMASWGLDFVKVDDLSAPYHRAEIAAIRTAIDRSGRQIIFSTSPGDTPLEDGEHIMRHANQWRISGDFWDDWEALYAQFDRVRKWAPFAGNGHFPDADMLPLGIVQMNRPTKFTREEQTTLMTLWSMARSPLILGGDMTKLDPFTLSLLTNDEVLAIDQNSSNNHQLFARDNSIGWLADVPNSRDKYLALFNVGDTAPFDASKAAFQSDLITRTTPGQGVKIDLDISGARKLVLVATTGGDDFVADHVDWTQPRVTTPQGEIKLSDLKSVQATTGWGEVSTQHAAGGAPMSVGGKAVEFGIAAHAPSVIEFDLPAGATRFQSFAALDDGGTRQEKGATVKFLVFTQMSDTATGYKIPISMRELGFENAQVRDLWAKKSLGNFRDFAPDIAPHGAGLYRVSPAR